MVPGNIGLIQDILISELCNRRPFLRMFTSTICYGIAA